MSSERIEIEASQWLARLDAAGDSVELARDIGAWRAADPRHEAAFLRLKALWGRFDRLQALRPPAARGVDAGLFAGEAVSAPAIERRAPSVRVGTRGRYALAAVLLLSAGATWFALRSGSVPQRFVTGVGGFERVLLADGSQVELNTDTELRVSLSPRARTIELLRGEANFSVAPDPGRPFVVSAGEAAVRVLGTQFNIRKRESSRVEVMVTEGSVMVGPRQSKAAHFGHAQGSGSQLQAGQGAMVGGDGDLVVRPVSPAVIRRALAWRAGMVLFDGEPLSEVVLEFNRYSVQRLVIADPQLASLKIGGYFKATNPDLFVRVLQSSFAVQARRDGDTIVLSAVSSSQ